MRVSSHIFTLLSRGSQVRVLPGALLLSEGLRPSDSPTRALARRFAGSLRSRGSLAPLVRDRSTTRWARRGRAPAAARREHASDARERGWGPASTKPGSSPAGRATRLRSLSLGELRRDSAPGGTRLRPEGHAEGRAPAAARREHASDARERGWGPASTKPGSSPAGRANFIRGASPRRTPHRLLAGTPKPRSARVALSPRSFAAPAPASIKQGSSPAGRANLHTSVSGRTTRSRASFGWARHPPPLKCEAFVARNRLWRDCAFVLVSRRSGNARRQADAPASKQ